jgi:CMP-N-acetylneuraminic acid synthetase
MTNVAIITARAGSKSILNKNIAPILGRPVIEYVIEAAHGAKKIDRVYCSTDGELIASVCRENDCEVIPRPEELGGDHINHGDVIKHAVEWVEARVPDLKNVVLLLGNTVMVTPALFDEALQMLDDEAALDGVMSVWEAADDHPLRAMEIKPDGLLQTYGGPREVSTERQSYPKAYYYDQGVWAFRKETVQKRDGPNPWWWMGKNVKPILRPWITGRDINGPFDVPFHEWWVKYPEITEAIMKLKV